MMERSGKKENEKCLLIRTGKRGMKGSVRGEDRKKVIKHKKCFITKRKN